MSEKKIIQFLTKDNGGVSDWEYDSHERRDEDHKTKCACGEDIYASVHYLYNIKTQKITPVGDTCFSYINKKSKGNGNKIEKTKKEYESNKDKFDWICDMCSERFKRCECTIPKSCHCGFTFMISNYDEQHESNNGLTIPHHRCIEECARCYSKTFKSHACHLFEYVTYEGKYKGKTLLYIVLKDWKYLYSKVDKETFKNTEFRDYVNGLNLEKIRFKFKLCEECDSVRYSYEMHDNDDDSGGECCEQCFNKRPIPITTVKKPETITIIRRPVPVDLVRYIPVGDRIHLSSAQKRSRSIMKK
jgi:hypothetical protein